MKRLVLAALLLVSTACATAGLTRVAAAYQRADEGVVAIGTVQHAAIELNKINICPTPPATEPACHKLLSDANTGIVVDAATDALTTMKAAPAGWKVAVTTAIDRITLRLDAAGKHEVSAYLTAARAIVNSF